MTFAYLLSIIRCLAAPCLMWIVVAGHYADPAPAMILKALLDFGVLPYGRKLMGRQVDNILKLRRRIG